jgi:hypothetical protein
MTSFFAHLHDFHARSFNDILLHLVLFMLERSTTPVLPHATTTFN